MSLFVHKELTSWICVARLGDLAWVPALVIETDHADGAVPVLHALWRGDGDAA